MNAAITSSRAGCAGPRLFLDHFDPPLSPTSHLDLTCGNGHAPSQDGWPEFQLSPSLKNNCISASASNANPALATVLQAFLSTFANLIFQKRSERANFYAFSMQIEVSLQSCALLVDKVCRSSAATAQTEILHMQPWKPLHTKKQVSRTRLFFKPELTRSRRVALPGQFMMMWLT